MMTRHAIHVIGAFWLLALPLSSAWGAEPAARAVDAAPFAAQGLLKVMLGLLAVLAMIGVAAWLLRRVARFHTAVNGALKLLGGMSLGARERVVLIQVGEKQLLLGVAPGRIQTLYVLDEPVSVSPAGADGTEPFSKWLKAASKGGGDA